MARAAFIGKGAKALLLGSAVLLYFGFSSLYAEETKIGDSASFSGIEELSLDSGSVDLTIMTVPAGRPLGVRRVDLPPSYEISAHRDGGRLELRVKAPAVDLRIGLKRSRVELTIPRAVRGVEIRSGSGDIAMSGTAAARIAVRAASGDIELRAASGETLDIESSSGSISIEDCSGELRAISSSGDVDVRSLRGKTRIETGSGDIVLESSSGDASLQSGSGEIRLKKTEGIVEARTGSGDIGGAAVSLTGDSSFSSGSGEIRVSFANRLEELRFALDSKSGGLRAGGSSAERGSLACGSGRLLVAGSSGSGEQDYSAR